MSARRPSEHGVAVIGCGYWGRNLIRNFAELGALSYLCDNDRIALGRQTSRHPGVPATTNFDEALADGRVDGVVIASPAAMHFSHVARALEAGKDVFVEKPLALHYTEGLTLVEMARSRDLILMVGHVLEYHPAVEALKAAVRAGELGELRYLYSNRLNLGEVRQAENILWSFAPHDISVITSLVGEAPLSVSAFGGTYLQDGIADVTVTNLVFAGDLRAHIFVSWLHPHKEQRLSVAGSRKMAIFDDTVAEGKLRIFDKRIDWANGVPSARHIAEATPQLARIEPLRNECAHFLESMRTRRQPLTGPDNALRVLSVLEAAQRSLDTEGQPVSLSTIEEVAAVA